jgi:hypothetical protein
LLTDVLTENQANRYRNALLDQLIDALNRNPNMDGCSITARKLDPSPNSKGSLNHWWQGSPRILGLQVWLSAQGCGPPDPSGRSVRMEYNSAELTVRTIDDPAGAARMFHLRAGPPWNRRQAQFLVEEDGRVTYARTVAERFVVSMKGRPRLVRSILTCPSSSN